MSVRARRFLKDLIPPIALPLARKLREMGIRPEWQYVPEGWQPDDSRGSGWTHPSVVESQVARWRDFLAAVNSTRPLGIEQESVRTHNESASAHNAILTFAYAVARAAAGSKSVSILDWGGGLGYYGAIACRIFPELEIDYAVMELPGAAAAGRQVNPDIQFFDDEQEALSRGSDLIFASNSLQYFRDWRGIIGRFRTSACRWIMLGRVPVVEKTATFAAVQRPEWLGYHTEYISWVLNRDELLREIESRDLVLEREFLTVNECLRVSGAPEQVTHRGFLLRGRSGAGGPG
jgi:putative methyltransferase (TIGR04325 family)